MLVREILERLGGGLFLPGVRQHHADAERHLLGVLAALVALAVLAVGADGALRIAEVLAQQARVVERVGGVRVLRPAIGEQLVVARRRIPQRRLLVQLGRRPRRLRCLLRVRILVDHAAVHLDRFLGLAAAHVGGGRVHQRRRRARALRELVGHAHVDRRCIERRGLGLLLAGLHPRIDHQLRQALLIGARLERRHLQQAARPPLDVLVVLGLGERLEDLVAGRRSDGCRRPALDDLAEPFDRLVVVAVVVEQLAVLEQDVGDLRIFRKQRRVQIDRLAHLPVRRDDLLARVFLLAHLLVGADRVEQGLAV